MPVERRVPRAKALTVTSPGVQVVSQDVYDMLSDIHQQIATMPSNSEEDNFISAGSMIATGTPQIRRGDIEVSEQVAGYTSFGRNFYNSHSISPIMTTESERSEREGEANQTGRRYYQPPTSPSQRSEPMMSPYVTIEADHFPKNNFIEWDSRSELDRIISNWKEHVSHKDNWIFSRREREGFNRRNIGQFGLEDILEKMDKRKKAHHLDAGNSRFYDWKLGGTAWILRLELYNYGGEHYLISRYIHTPSNAEVMYTVRHWNGVQFQYITGFFSEQSKSQNVRLLNESYYHDYDDNHDGDDDYSNDNDYYEEED